MVTYRSTSFNTRPSILDLPLPCGPCTNATVAIHRQPRQTRIVSFTVTTSTMGQEPKQGPRTKTEAKNQDREQGTRKKTPTRQIIQIIPQSHLRVLPRLPTPLRIRVFQFRAAAAVIAERETSEGGGAEPLVCFEFYRTVRSGNISMAGGGGGLEVEGKGKTYRDSRASRRL